MLPNTFTATDTTEYDKVFAATSNSKYSVEGSLQNPKTIAVKHNNAQGKTSTAIEVVDDIEVTEGTGVAISRLKLLIKLQYDGKRPDTASQLAVMAQQAKEFFDAELASLLNKEV